MGWKARLLTGLMLVAMLMVIAAPAMAGDKDRHYRHENRFENRFDHVDFDDFDDFDCDHHDCDFDDCDHHDCDFDDCDNHDCDFDEDFFVNDFFFVPTLFTVELDDIDCNGLDDDFDGLVDEDVVCVLTFDVDEV
jgi:hypothetical protein